MAAVCLSLLWTNIFTCSVVCTGHFSALSTFHYCRPFATACYSTLTAVRHFIAGCWTLTAVRHSLQYDTYFSILAAGHWLLFTKCSSFYSPGPYSIEDTVSNCLVVTQRVWLLWGACLPKQRSVRRIPRQHSIVSWGVLNCSVTSIVL
jgi:hypothetical protein